MFITSRYFLCTAFTFLLWPLLQYPFHLHFHNSSGGFLYFFFFLLSFLPCWLYVNTNPFWVVKVKGVSVILCAQADFLSVQNESAWVFWHFWKQHKALVYFSSVLKWLLMPSSSELDAFLCIWLLLALLFFSLTISHYYLWCSGLIFCLLITNVFSSRSKCGERDELSPKRIKIEVQYCGSSISNHAC